MKLTCHVDKINDVPAPLSHIRITLYFNDGGPLVYEAKATCPHVKHVGGAFAEAFAEITRQVAQAHNI